MKLGPLCALSVAGMLLAGGTVYSFTPPGGAASPPAPAVAEAAPAAATSVSSTSASRFTASGALLVEATLGHDALPRDRRSETFLLLEARGAGDGPATQRVPVHLALAIDRSGSMRGERLRNAIQAARAAVDRLQDGDVVSVTGFDTRAEVIVPPTPLAPRTRASIAADIGRISLGGDTCISCALEAGADLLGREGDSIRRMVLLSDGDATAGVRDVPGFRSIAQRARDRGISITTVGVNVDYNERILSAIAEESNGQHYFVEDEAALARALDEEAATLTRTVAGGAEASFELAPGVELDRVFDRSFRRDGRRIVVPLGTFSRGEVKTVLLKVRLSPAAQASEAPVASVALGYRDLLSGEPATARGALSARLTDDSAQESPLDPVVAARVQRSETADALLEANRLFSQGQIDAARRKLDERTASLRSATASNKASPAPRAGAASDDLAGQAAALDRANIRFQRPSSMAPSAPFAESREGKGAVKEATRDIFQMNR